MLGRSDLMCREPTKSVRQPFHRLQTSPEAVPQSKESQAASPTSKFQLRRVFIPRRMFGRCQTVPAGRGESATNIPQSSLQFFTEAPFKSIVDINIFSISNFPLSIFHFPRKVKRLSLEETWPRAIPRMQ